MEVGIDDGGQDGNTLLLERDLGGVQNSTHQVQAADSRCLSDAMGSGQSVVCVENGGRAEVRGLGQKYPLDQTDLRELSGQSVHTADDPLFGVRSCSRVLE